MDAPRLQRVFHARTNGWTADVKSCGPGIPVLMPSRRLMTSARAMGAREPVPKEITYKR